MSPLPVDQTGDSQRSIPTPFLTKTFQLVEDPSMNDLVSWNEDGSTFIVWRPAEFSRDLLPKYFKHNNFSSFVRQLNTYGFRKVMPDRWEFAHDCFKRDDKALLRDILRRKHASPTPIPAVAAAVTVAAPPPPPLVVAPPPPPPPASPVISEEEPEAVVSCNSSPAMPPPVTGGTTTTSCTTTPELLEENARLRCQNSHLTQELGQMRGLCGNIFSMMSNYSSGQNDGGEVEQNRNRPLDLLPTGQSDVDDGGCSFGGSSSKNGGGVVVNVVQDTSPRLFGVSIGAKRVRINDEGDEWEKSRQDHVQLQAQADRLRDVKFQPLDVNTEYQDRSW